MTYSQQASKALYAAFAGADDEYGSRPAAFRITDSTPHQPQRSMADAFAIAFIS